MRLGRPRKSAERQAPKRRRLSVPELLETFEEEIRRHEDILYGIALFFECISLLLEGQDVIVETHRKQLRNVIQSGKKVTDQASALLRGARADPEKADAIEAFAFKLGEGHPDPEALLARAEALVSAYKALFPDRPRSKAFTAEETMRLMEKAAETCDLKPD